MATTTISVQMLFLKKDSKSIILQENLTYENDSKRINELLMIEQKNFCAYSERYLMPLDAVEVEHFDPTDKNTQRDSYYNWYATLRWINNHKYKKLDTRFLPICFPHDESLEHRITYKDGIFVPIDENDFKIKHLIEFLGINKPEVYLERLNHVKLIKNLRFLAGNEEIFKSTLISFKQYLSFGTALRHELGIDIFDYLLENQ